MQYEELAITGENQFTPWINLMAKNKNEQRQFFDVFVTNIQGNTVAVQAKRPDEADVLAQDLAGPPDAANPHVWGSVVQSMLVRVGVPSGGYVAAGTTVSIAGGK